MRNDRSVHDLGPRELVDFLHPMDKWTAENSAAAAQQVRELVRYLNHATLWENINESLPYPGDGSGVISALCGAVGGLSQLLQQLASQYRGWADTENLRSDQMAYEDMTAAEIARSVAADLAEVEMTMAAAADAFHDAANKAARLGLKMGAYLAEED